MHSRHKRFSLGARLQSFQYAFEGLYYMFKSQHNAWIHALIAILVIIAGFSFCITAMEWIMVILAIGSVLALEAINTALEELTNLISPDHHMKAKRAKDLAAAAVLLASIVAALIGLIIFTPYIVQLFGNV